MKQKRLLALSLVLVLFVSMFAMVPSAGAATGPVNLIYAKPVGKTGFLSAKGYVEVENLGFAKNVTIHYTKDKGTTWEDTAATYMQPTWGNYEVWEFETDTLDYGYWGIGTISFAIKYEVNGQVFWDNNNGNNYTVKKGYCVNTEFDFGGSGFVALYTSYRGEDNINGSVQLKDIAYEKDVKVRYTTDNWATYKEVSAKYGFNIKNGVQYWSYVIPYTEKPVEFAISYTVNGVTYWDNNFGLNYTV